MKFDPKEAFKKWEEMPVPDEDSVVQFELQRDVILGSLLHYQTYIEDVKARTQYENTMLSLAMRQTLALEKIAAALTKIAFPGDNDALTVYVKE